MDPSRFDDLARLLSSAGGRRSVLRALLGTLLGATVTRAAAKPRGKAPARAKRQGHGPGQETVQGQVHRPDKGQGQAKGKGKGKGKGKKGRGQRKGKAPGGQNPVGDAPPRPASCCGSQTCASPIAGGVHEGCDYAGQDLSGRDHHGAHFSGIDGRGTRFTNTDHRGAVFTDACLQGADFRRARLHGTLFDGACLVGADFNGADLGANPDFFDAILCRTVLPDGSVSDRNCDSPTACCPTTLAAPDPQQCSGPTPGCSACCSGTCCQPPANQCNPAGLCCTPNCVERECGDDGCGGTGTCGSCPNGTACFEDNGQCVCDPGTCDGCCAGLGTVCEAGTTTQNCGSGGAPCTTCDGQEACQNGQCVCVPDCANKDCGPDGCGGSCGTCPNGLACDDASGRCLCTTASCPNGCCTNGPGNPGACLPGDTDQSCNKGGLRCVACASGSTCGGRGCQPVDCRSLCGTTFCLNLVEGNVACQVPLATVCNDTDPDLTICTSTAECAAREAPFTLCVASYTDPTTNQTAVLFCGGQPNALCARDDG